MSYSVPESKATYDDCDVFCDEMYAHMLSSPARAIMELTTAPSKPLYRYGLRTEPIEIPKHTDTPWHAYIMNEWWLWLCMNSINTR